MKKEISTLTIKAFHITEVMICNQTKIENKILKINQNLISQALKGKEEYIKELTVKIIKPDGKDIFVNSIMDFVPIASKVTGKIGEGITHTLTGVCVMLTGVDDDGVQVAEFGSSEGLLKNQVVFNKAGTPQDTDIIIHVDAVLQKGMGTVRKAVTEAHKACDYIVQDIREQMKRLKGIYCDEKHEYVHSIDDSKKTIAVIKQVAGQGAMYDTCILPIEPCGVEGSNSIIDLGNMPVVLTPNEYRDGAIRAMY